MLFRNAEGKLIELNRYDFKNDHIYYKKILHIKNIFNNNNNANSPKDAAANYSKNLIENAIQMTLIDACKTSESIVKSTK